MTDKTVSVPQLPPKPRIMKIVRTCCACPSQWDAETDDGRHVYMRFRWGSFGHGIGATRDEAVDDCDYTDGLADEYDGFLADDKMLTVAAKYYDIAPNAIEGERLNEFIWWG